MGEARDSRLTQLLNAVRGRKNPVMQVHNNRDPDAIGSAVGLQALFKRFLNLDSRIVFGGIVGRAENRAMLRLLEIHIVPAHKVDYDECDLLALVDTQPGLGHAAIPDNRVPEVVIDHHPPRSDPNEVLYWDVGRPYGATSTIVTELFLKNGVELRKDVATALLYGVKSDTHDLSDAATDEDLRAYTELISHADTTILAKIENAPVPPPYFAVFQRAIENAVIYDFACVSHLGKIDNPDMIAEMADFLMRCENLRWTMVTGIYKDTLYLSLRSVDKNSHAGHVARRAVGKMGYAGGHGRMAGGQVRLGDLDKSTRRRTIDAVTDMFLDTVKAKRSLSHPLADGVLPDETDTKDLIAE